MKYTKERSKLLGAGEYIAFLGATITSWNVVHYRASMLRICILSLAWGVVLGTLSLTKLRKQYNTETAWIARVKLTLGLLAIVSIVSIAVIAATPSPLTVGTIHLAAYYILMLAVQATTTLIGTYFKRN